MLSVNLPVGVVRRFEGDGRAAPAEDLSGYQVVRPGDLVMNQLGKPHGALGISQYLGIISPAYFVATVGPTAEPAFVHHLLRTRLYISEYERRGKFMPPSQFDISWDQFRSIEVMLPPRGEQRAIASFLDRETARIDALVAGKRRMIIALDARLVSFRKHQLLGGMDPVAGRGPARPVWPTANLGTIVALQRGHDLPTEVRRAGSVPVVSSGGVSGHHDVAACEPPGVVTGRYGTIGEVFYVDVPYWPLNTTLYVQDFRDNEPRWVFHLLRALPLDFDAEKSAVTGINRNVIGHLRVSVPPAEQQREIAASVDRLADATSALVKRLTRQIDLLVEHRQALITAAVTGELEIPGVAA